MMQLYITETSPYARIVRVVVLEKELSDRLDVVVADTRVVDSAYYRINPSGRVPYLVRDDGVGLEDSALIAAYLDQLDGAPRFAPPADDMVWEWRRLAEYARSMLDGLSVLLRELRRPANEQSPTIVAHEIERARRLTAWWESQLDHELMQDELNLIQITLICALELDQRLPTFKWRETHPRLSHWADRLAQRPSIAKTRYV